MPRRTGLGALPFEAALKDAVGSRLKVHPHDTVAYAVCGVRPNVAISPRTLDEISAAVVTIAREQTSLVVRGAGTKSNAPPAPLALDVVLDMSAYAGFVEYEPADLTCTVRAGTRLADLQSRLAREGQWLPWDPPFAAHATVGGTLSADAAGALRLRYGSARDSVIGLRVVTADGAAPFAGAKVVKSVAGFDAHKLFLGARGTLGVICDVTLKVAPIPPVAGGVWARFASVDGACSAALALARSPLFPSAVTVMSTRAAERVRALSAPAAGWVLAARFGGVASGVRRQVTETVQVCKSAGAVVADPLDARAIEGAWPDVAELAAGAHYPAQEWIAIKLSCLPSGVAPLLAQIAQALPGAEICAHAGSGVTFVAVPVAHESRESPDLQPIWRAAHGAFAAVLAAPFDLGVDMRAPLAASVPVAHLRRLKSALDPDGVFDPGRYVGGV